MTINSRAYDQHIVNLDPNIDVLGVACPDLLRLAEKGQIDDRPHLLSLGRKYFQPLADFEIDTLILGCTDLTCVRDIAETVAGDRVAVIDPAEEVVRQAHQIMQAAGGLNPQEGGLADYQFLITGDDQANFAAFTRRFLSLSQVAVTRITLEEIQQALPAEAQE